MNPSNRTLKFSYNWNNKLDCKYCITIREANQFNISTLRAGQDIMIWYKNLMLGPWYIENTSVMNFSSIPDILLYLDTGYPKKDVIEVFSKMCKIDISKLNNTQFIIILLRNEKFKVNNKFPLIKIAPGAK